jgi:hypothetical protein
MTLHSLTLLKTVIYTLRPMYEGSAAANVQLWCRRII